MVAVKERKSGVSKFVLPTKMNTPPQRLLDSIIVLYGRKGIGKSSLFGQDPKTLTCMFERGRRNLEIFMVPQEGEPELDWETFKSVVEAYLESDDFDTLVVDTMDRAYECCMEYVCKKAGCTHPNDKNDFGKTWQAVKLEFQSVFAVIQDSGKGLVLLSHETPKPLNKQGKGMVRDSVAQEVQLERLEPSCSKQAFEVVQEICDYVLYYGYREEYRCITVRSPSDIVWTSCGMGDRFTDPDGTPINTFKVGNSPKEAYQSLIDAHSNKLRDFDWAEPKEPKVFKKRES
jgi:hypothetical protein